MTSLYSRHSSGLDWSDSDQDQDDDDYGVYWRTDPILPDEPLAVSLGPPLASTSTIPIQSTPNPKRTTTAASLPSPSASLAPTEAEPQSKPVRALRDRKKLRPGKARACGTGSVGVDQLTLLAIGRLERRLNAKRVGVDGVGVGVGVGVAIGRVALGPDAGAVADGKGKEKESGRTAAPASLSAAPPARRPTAKAQSTTRPSSSVPSPAFSPSRPALHPFTSSKPGLASSSAMTKPAPAPSCLSPFRPAKLAPAAPNPPAGTAPPTSPMPRAPPLRKSPAPGAAGDSDDEFSTYFDNDVSFELALSQLDAPDAVAVPAAATLPPPRAQPPARTSARLAAPGPPLTMVQAARAAPAAARAVAQPPPRHARAAPPRAPRPAFPIDSPASASSSSMASPATVRASRASRASPLLPKALAGLNRRAPVPALKYGAVKAGQADSPLAKGAKAAGGVIIALSLSQGTSSQQQQAEMRALAQQELDALVEEGVAEGWSEDDDF